MGREKLRHDSSFATLALILFRDFLADTGRTTDDAERVQMRDFYTYLHDRDPLFESPQALMKEYGLEDGELAEFEQACQDPFAFVWHMIPRWPLLALASRRPPQHVLDRMVVSVALHYADGHRFAFGSPMTVETNGEPFTDGQVIALGEQAVWAQLEHIRKYGLDGVYRMTKSPTGTTSHVPAPDVPGSG